MLLLFVGSYAGYRNGETTPIYTAAVHPLKDGSLSIHQNCVRAALEFALPDMLGMERGVMATVAGFVHPWLFSLHQQVTCRWSLLETMSFPPAISPTPNLVTVCW